MTASFVSSSALYLGNPALDAHEILLPLARVSAIMSNIFLHIGLFFC